MAGERLNPLKSSLLKQKVKFRQKPALVFPLKLTILRGIPKFCIMSETNQTFLLSLLIILSGIFLKNRQIIHADDGRALSRIVLNFTFPALILSKVRKMPLDTEMLYLPMICFGFCLFLTLTGVYIFRAKLPKDKGLLLMAIGGFNIGLFAFPLVEGIWGAKGLQYIAMFDIGNALVVLGLGYFFGAYHSPLRDKNVKLNFSYIIGLFLRSLPFMSYLLALLFNYFTVEFHPLADRFFETVARANMPLVLLLLGIYFNLKIDKSKIKQLLTLISIRYVAGLAIGLLLYFTLPFGQLYRTIILVGLVMPVGLTAIPFSDKFGYDTKFAASLANVTIVISFVFMWLIVNFTA